MTNRCRPRVCHSALWFADCQWIREWRSRCAAPSFCQEMGLWETACSNLRYYLARECARRPDPIQNSSSSYVCMYVHYWNARAPQREDHNNTKQILIDLQYRKRVGSPCFALRWWRQCSCSCLWGRRPSLSRHRSLELLKSQAKSGPCESPTILKHSITKYIWSPEFQTKNVILSLSRILSFSLFLEQRRWRVGYPS